MEKDYELHLETSMNESPTSYDAQEGCSHYFQPQNYAEKKYEYAGNDSAGSQQNRWELSLYYDQNILTFTSRKSVIVTRTPINQQIEIEVLSKQKHENEFNENALVISLNIVNIENMLKNEEGHYF